MSVKRYQFFCDHCGYKRQTDGTDIQDLREIKTSPIPGSSPVLDPFAKKTAEPVFGQPSVEATGIRVPRNTPQRKKFKCPKCGYVIMARKLTPIEEPIEEPNETNNPDGCETSPSGQSLPGELAD